MRDRKFDRKPDRRMGFATEKDNAIRKGPNRDRPPRKDAPPRPSLPPRPPRMPQMPVPPLVEDAEDERIILVGRNAIREALLADRDIEKLLVAKGDQNGTARQIVAMARERHIPVQEVERRRLDALSAGHQGLAAIASAYPYAQVEDMLQLARDRQEAPFLVILDGITDPHNVGAIIRTAAAMGAHGVILPARRAAGLTPAAVKASCGGIEHVPIAKAGNLTQEIQRLKAQGLWIYAADAAGEPLEQVDFTGPCALVIGSEGEGVSRLVGENCDKTVSIPMRTDQMESLNASVAAGILMYHIASGRKGAEPIQ